MKRIALSIFALAAFCAALVAGCGGGGGSASGGSAGTLGVFVTDAFSDDYDQVWITIRRVELLSASGQTETVFDDPAGRVINLKSLRDAAGQRFAFLGNARASAQIHSQVRVTIGSAVTLFARGSTTGQSVPATTSVITFPLTSPRNLASGNDDLVIDFDLAGFVVANGAVAPALREGGRNGLDDPARGVNEDFKGTIAGLSGTAPNFTFTLALPGQSSFTVETNANTAIFNSNGAPNPTLANGRTVEVRGTFNAATNRLVATEVKIEDEPGQDNEPEVRGAPSAVNAGAGTFVVTVGQAVGFVPVQTTVNVVTTPGTVFRASGGLTLARDEFFARLPAAPEVEVEGVYDPATNTLTARKAKIENPNEAREAEVKGRAADINAAAGTFRVSPIEEFEGFVPAGGSVTVATNAGTAFEDRDGNRLTAAAFFAALTSGTRVDAKGVPAGGTITAVRVRLRSPS